MTLCYPSQKTSKLLLVGSCAWSEGGNTCVSQYRYKAWGQVCILPQKGIAQTTAADKQVKNGTVRSRMAHWVPPSQGAFVEELHAFEVSFCWWSKWWASKHTPLSSIRQMWQPLSNRIWADAEAAAFMLTPSLSVCGRARGFAPCCSQPGLSRVGDGVTGCHIPSPLKC